MARHPSLADTYVPNPERTFDAQDIVTSVTRSGAVITLTTIFPDTAFMSIDNPDRPPVLTRRKGYYDADGNWEGEVIPIFQGAEFDFRVYRSFAGEPGDALPEHYYRFDSNAYQDGVWKPPLRYDAASGQLVPDTTSGVEFLDVEALPVFHGFPLPYGPIARRVKDGKTFVTSLFHPVDVVNIAYEGPRIILTLAEAPADDQDIDLLMYRPFGEQDHARTVFDAYYFSDGISESDPERTNYGFRVRDTIWTNGGIQRDFDRPPYEQKSDLEPWLSVTYEAQAPFNKRRPLNPIFIPAPAFES